MTRNEAPFAIKTDAFEGPLELLLELIEKRKLLINDISLAEVTDEYIIHVEQMQEHPINETAQFVLVASTLLLIKSKSLLPVLDLTEEEEGNIEDLEKRLKLYQIYRDAGKGIQKHFGDHMLYGRHFIQHKEPIFKPDSYTHIDQLMAAMHDILKNLPRPQEKKKVAVKQVISLEQMIDKLRKRVEKNFKISFREFSGGERERHNVIVGFLAVLELVKQGIVMVRQERRHMDFEIEHDDTLSTPHYH